MCRRSWTQRAGYPAGFTLPQCTKRTRCWRARPAARRDQNRTAGRVLVRRTPIGRRSTTAGNPASTSDASGSAGVETTRSPRGNRFASSPCNRAMPPPIGGKSCAKSSVVIETNLRSRSAEFPVDPDQIGRDPVPIVVALDRGATGGAPAPDPGDGVACPRNGGPDGGERPDDRVDPLVEVETGDGEDPRAPVEPIGAPGGPGVNAGTEMGGRRAEVHDPDVGGEGVAAEGLEHGAGQIRGPAAVGDDHGAAL